MILKPYKVQVQLTGDDYIMLGVGNEEYYAPIYKNITLYEGNEISISGVMVDFIPAKGSDDVIPASIFNVNAIKGTGTIQTNGIYEMMGVGNTEYYIPKYDNLSLESGDVLAIEGVKIELDPTTEEFIVQEKIEAKEAYEVEEKVIVDQDNMETCYIDDEMVKCENLKYLSDLETEINSQMNE